jgi:hypothetical protein
MAALTHALTLRGRRAAPGPAEPRSLLHKNATSGSENDQPHTQLYKAD